MAAPGRGLKSAVFENGAAIQYAIDCAIPFIGRVVPLRTENAIAVCPVAYAKVLYKHVRSCGLSPERGESAL